MHSGVIYLSAIILLFLDLKGALLHSPLEFEFHSKPEAFGYASPTVDFGPVQVENFFQANWGIEPTPIAMNQIQ